MKWNNIDTSSNKYKCPHCGSTNLVGKTKTKGKNKQMQIVIAKCNGCQTRWIQKTPVTK